MKYEELWIQADQETKGAKLNVYLWDVSDEFYQGRKRPLVLICPGGGYGMTSDREAEPIAFQYLAAGYHTAVLRYSVAPAQYPTALMELALAVAKVREHADDWNIDADKIAVQGFSAGGHLAASLGVFWHEEWLSKKLGLEATDIQPNGLMLSYPVITSGEFAHQGSFENLLGERQAELREKMSLEKQVTEYTPKTFIWHTFTDDAVPVENSLYFIQALRKKGIPTEFHMYPEGGHGLSLANELTVHAEYAEAGIEPHCESWIKLAIAWLNKNFGA